MKLRYDVVIDVQVEQRRREALNQNGEDSPSSLEDSLQQLIARYRFLDLWPCSSSDLDHLARQQVCMVHCSCHSLSFHKDHDCTYSKLSFMFILVSRIELERHYLEVFNVTEFVWSTLGQKQFFYLFPGQLVSDIKWELKFVCHFS